MYKTERWYYEKINKMDKPLARFTKKEKRAQVSTDRDESGEVTNDTTDIRRIIRDYYEQLCINKLLILPTMWNK